ncbi:MAG: D-glycero-beta-D-manno-heptose 1-phosphate adenylyltransferase [Gemmatimonadaceae bacterium]
MTSASIEPLRKIMDWARATEWRSEQGGRLVFTNGVFDLLHPGHVDVLLAARHQGDALVVGLNSDASVRRLKGPTRPIRTLAERSYVLAALAMVDAVVSFEQDTPLQLILHLHPDVVVKGGDYSVETVVGAREVRAWGGEVIIVPLTAGQSTTSIIERLRER